MLQPNKKIKHPHSPTDGKAVADISAKHCIHCGRKPKHIARREENFDEFLFVPCVPEAKINIHPEIHRALVLREQPPRIE